MAVTRRSAPTKKTSVKRKAPAKKSVTKKVTALARTVRKLTKISYDKVTMKLLPTDGTAVTLPYYQWHVNQRLDLWTPIFGSSAADVNNSDKMYVNSYKVDMRLFQDNEADRIFYTMFIVSLKDQGADSTTFDPATGMLTLADNVHYQTLPGNGRVLVNPKFFNIHAYKRFTMGGRPGDQPTPETRDLSFTIVPKQKMVVNPRGNVLQNGLFTFMKDPSQNYYVLLFNDDAGADFQTNKISIGGIANIAVPN